MTTGSPNVWDIFVAISTAAAAIFTGVGVVVALVVAYREHLRTKSNEQAASAAAEREQADRIAAWLTSSRSPLGQPLVAGLSNATSVPVYDLIIAVVTVGESESGAERYAVIPVLPPGQWWVHIEGRYLDAHGRYRLEYSFTDTSGRRWQRKKDGDLRRLAGEPATIYGQAPRPAAYPDLLSVQPPSPQNPMS